MSETPAQTRSAKRSLFALLADLPRLFGDLVREEIDQLKNEVVGKIKHAGIGIGLFAAAAFFAFFAVAVLVAAAVLGIAEALPAWLAALIVAVALLVITGILAGIDCPFVVEGPDELRPLVRALAERLSAAAAA